MCCKNLIFSKWLILSSTKTLEVEVAEIDCYRPMHVIQPVFWPFTFLIGRVKLETWKGRDWAHHHYRYDKDSSSAWYEGFWDGWECYDRILEIGFGSDLYIGNVVVGSMIWVMRGCLEKCLEKCWTNANNFSKPVLKIIHNQHVFMFFLSRKQNTRF